MPQKTIKLHNTKSRTIEEFVPIHEGKIGMYSCGPTVYNYVHLGNLRGYVVTDIVRRMFEYAGYDVEEIINITDIGHLVTDGDEGEDKMTKALIREGKSITLESMREVADFYFEQFKENLNSLNILAPSAYPFASDNIKEDIDMVFALLERGFAYSTSDGIYFETAKFPQYRDLAKLDVEGLKSGARVSENKEKRGSTDFAIWKFNSTLGYEAPFGKGFPGWHIECSAMSKKYLGVHFDIHMGGIDHIPVHHTNEIAQSECANGEPYVNYWVHYNFLNDKSGKMAKSSGDFLRLQSIIDAGISPLAYRYYLLTVHYRSEISFSFESLEAASVSYEKLVRFVQEYMTTEGVVDQKYTALFEEDLFDDVGTPAVISTIWKMMKDDTVTDENKVATILAIDEVLGLDLENQARKELAKKETVIPEEVQTLLDKRAEAKETKDFVTSDALRKEIENLGFTVKDTSNGQEVSGR